MTLFSVVDVTIHILDANDNKPRFDQASYLRYVNETAAPGTNIIRIQVCNYYLLIYNYEPVHEISNNVVCATSLC